MYLLDTNIISEMRKIPRGTANAGLAAWLAGQRQDNLYTSAVVLMELERGVLGMERKDKAQGARLRAWFDGIKEIFGGRILPADADTAAVCATLHIPDKAPENDAWIAATAKQHRLILVTRNIADFERTGVRLINPLG
ncbi:type II toxin-antitoxin system VapC family toxin [Neisseria sp. 23W00296]|uniref:type II toxin-antitoxin system VapC family toxin n=1 Tax=unclassified Neisseria TaxID=2623750 RepID=UPI0002A1D822|nr:MULTISPECIES: type II toxin-antitoxin system VapC family toxin [unclassified Neisseria]ASP17721.1 PIN domain-containing protein [Neisseria sp. KEM232]EKY08838.1 PIN domain protein [Neisseria sp. oral taxon 020 str. F0370]